MTARELKINRAVLEYLHSLDFGQATELQIHANAFQPPFDSPVPSVAEIGVALRVLDAAKCITGVPSRFANKMKWNITDTGEAARLDMQ